MDNPIFEGIWIGIKSGVWNALQDSIQEKAEELKKGTGKRRK